MSLILEALKKSEAERRLGQAPNLMTPMPTRRERRRAGPVMAIVLALATVSAMTAWWWTHNQDETTASTVSASASPASVNPSDQATEAATLDSAPRAPGTPAETTPTTPESRPASIAARPAAVTPPVPAPMPEDPGFASLERESVPAAAPASPPTIAAPVPNSGLGQSDSGAETPAISSSATTAAPPPPIDAVPIDAAPDLPRLDQLTAAERDALPPLKLSMHVYAEDPMGRFVLVDGRRYREGEKLAASLQVIAIRREGVVMDFNGRQFLLMRP